MCPLSHMKWTVAVLFTLLTDHAEADEWWGKDKALHFTASIGMSVGAYALSVPLTEHREVRVLAGAGTSMLAGAAKEGHDALGYGDPSWRDFAWDIVGTVVGVTIAYAVDCLVSEPRRRSAVGSVPSSSPLILSF